jgi:hypothetical protein
MKSGIPARELMVYVAIMRNLHFAKAGVNRLRTARLYLGSGLGRPCRYPERSLMTKRGKAALELSILLGLLIAGSIVFVGYEMAQASQGLWR